ncbi:Cof-type HAD-IIB family hydrolase [Aminirod propionatiphilus]|uniref:HAD family phosphatase n=1 Tax=Aminirod propionatiphilus TaxID=3415223 RepID=A0ACD1DW30_9BACT|nr:HAD family phosphatase [Synergistota bacterium]
MTIRLVAADLDDTLLDSAGTLRPRTLEAIEACRRRGVVVTVASGRMFRSIAPYGALMGDNLTLIAYNGGLIREAASGRTLRHRTVEAGLAAEVRALCRRRGWYVQTYIDDELYVESRDDDRARAYEKLAAIEAIPLGDAYWDLDGEPTKMLLIDDATAMVSIAEEMRSRFAGRLSLPRSKPGYLEVVPLDVDKGRALAFLARSMGLGREEVMAIGDGENDLTMIEWAGLGVAMANGSPLARERAAIVTASNDDDGVALALERHVLSLP